MELQRTGVIQTTCGRVHLFCPTTIARPVIATKLTDQMYSSSQPLNLQHDPKAAWMMEIGKSQRPAAEKLLPINSKIGVAAARNRLYSHHSVSIYFIASFAVKTKGTDERNEPNRQWLTPINTDKVCYWGGCRKFSFTCSECKSYLVWRV